MLCRGGIIGKLISLNVPALRFHARYYYSCQRARVHLLRSGFETEDQVSVDFTLQDYETIPLGHGWLQDPS